MAAPHCSWFKYFYHFSSCNNVSRMFLWHLIQYVFFKFVHALFMGRFVFFIIGPKPPENIFLYQLSDSAILFRWDPPSAPNNFFVDYVVSYVNTATGVAQENVLPRGASSNDIRSLTAGTTYDFGVFTNIDPITSVFSPFTPVPLSSKQVNLFAFFQMSYFPYN